MNKRTEMQGFRTSKETKKELADVAEHYGLLPGPFVACLVERFLEAHKKYNKISWPPEFIRFDTFLDKSYYKNQQEFEEKYTSQGLEFFDPVGLSDEEIEEKQAKTREILQQQKDEQNK